MIEHDSLRGQRDAETLRQLREFHGSDLTAPSVGPVCGSTLRLAAARSRLIEIDPMAADGHEEALLDMLDTHTIRWLVWYASREYAP